jgi:hypothetical protein
MGFDGLYSRPEWVLESVSSDFLNEGLDNVVERLY